MLISAAALLSATVLAFAFVYLLASALHTWSRNRARERETARNFFRSVRENRQRSEFARRATTNDGWPL